MFCAPSMPGLSQHRLVIAWFVVVFCSSQLWSQVLTSSDAFQLCGGLTDPVGCTRDLLSSQSENPDLRATLALFLFRAGEIDEALTEIEIAQAISPDVIGYHVLRAQLLKAHGDIEGSQLEGLKIRELREAKRERMLTDPDVESADLRGEAFGAQIDGDFEIARKLYQRYFEIQDNPHPLNLAAYAKVLFQLGDYDGAMEVMDDAFEVVGPDDLEGRATLLDKRASMKKRHGDLAGAEADKLEFQELVDRVKALRSSTVQDVQE